MAHKKAARRAAALVVGLLFGLSVAAVSAPPAAAHHVVTNCNNDAAGIDEIFFEWNNIVFVGVDTGIGVAISGKAVCVVVLGVHNSVLVDVLDPIPAYTGNTIRVRRCTSTTACTTVLDQTGVELNTTAPLFSCVYVDGVQQNPGCP